MHLYRFDANRRLFEAEEQDLFADIQSLPRNAALRKLNDLIKRARLAKVHAYIISSLRKEMPSMFGKDSKKKDLIKHLSNIYAEIERDHHIPIGDFPDIREMQEKLLQFDFTEFNPLRKPLVDTVDRMLADDISRLMSMIPHEQQIETKEELTVVKGGAFDFQAKESPFGYGRGEGIDAGTFDSEWVVLKEKDRYDELFKSLGPSDGKITGAAAKGEMVKSKLPNSVLGKVWKLADFDQDGMLDEEEFALAMHLISIKLDGHDLPTSLPNHLIPPSKR